MNDALVENWNSRVDKGDYVVIVGDFAFSRHQEWINILNGKKILVRGNHDKMSHDVERNFTSTHEMLLKKINGQHIFFCHYAMRTWPGPYQRTWHLYGHTHGRMPESSDFMSCDVGVDVWGYAPVSFDMIAEKMQTLKASAVAEKDPYEERVIKVREENIAIRQKFE